MDRYNRIRILLRLADLCTPSESERRKKYMDEVDNLLEDPACVITTPYDDLMELFDFDAPKVKWSWKQVSDLLADPRIKALGDGSTEALGMRLAGMARGEYGIRKKRSKRGSLYYLPPIGNDGGVSDASISD